MITWLEVHLDEAIDRCRVVVGQRGQVLDGSRQRDSGHSGRHGRDVFVGQLGLVEADELLQPPILVCPSQPLSVPPLLGQVETCGFPENETMLECFQLVFRGYLIFQSN